MQASNEKGETYEVEDLPMPSLRGHAWRQYGNKLECQSCSVPHAAFLQPGTYVSGNTADGTPVVSQITTLPFDPLQGGGSVSTPDQQLDTEPRPAS